jgi:Xaa-Pro aminopeptidase
VIEQSEYSSRRQRLLDGLDEIDAIFVTAPPNVRYLSGFTGSNGLVVLSRGSATLFTDPRYTIQAAGETSCRVTVARGNLIPSAAKLALRKRWRRIAFERNRVSFAQYTALREACGRSVELVETADVIERLRMIKSAAEIELIRESVLLNARAFERTVKKVKSTMTELDLATEMDFQMRRLGAEGPAFDSIVAAGPRSALPHARPSAEPIGTNRILLMDTGAVRSGYCSDMTRVLHLGTPPRRSRQLYNAVLEAQQAATHTVRAGVKASVPDRAARRVLRSHHLDGAFVHSTGHGLGLEIHEAPRLGKREQSRLEAGMTVTIEPGAYIEGFGGVRIEDTVVVTEKGCEVLTPVSKDFLAL